MSALEELYKELSKGEDISLEKILNTLLKSDEHLSLKTHVERPLELTALKTIAERLEHKNLKQSASLLKRFIRIYLEYMVSFKRMSREETIQAIIGKKEQGLDKVKKLMGVP